MELQEALRARRMTRDFRPDPIEGGLIEELLDLARRAPSAGNTHAMSWLVLDDPAAVAAYWDTTLAPAKRDSFPWPGLLRAPVLVLPTVEAARYVDRYAEADKAATGLGAGVDRWAVPYWYVDGGMAVMALLLAATDAGLGALFFGLFEHEAAVRARFGIPEGAQPLGTVALGWPAASQRPSSSARRGRPPLADLVHRGRWGRGLVAGHPPRQ